MLLPFASQRPAAVASAGACFNSSMWRRAAHCYPLSLPQTACRCGWAWCRRAPAARCSTAATRTARTQPTSKGHASLCLATSVLLLLAGQWLMLLLPPWQHHSALTSLPPHLGLHLLRNNVCRCWLLQERPGSGTGQLLPHHPRRPAGVLPILRPAHGGWAWVAGGSGCAACSHCPCG